MSNPSSHKGIQKICSHSVWALVAAIGTYFCMYGFRKPYIGATYSSMQFLRIDYRFSIVIAQTTGYVIAKWTGRKIVSALPLLKIIIGDTF
ncbi:MAG TPA: DUF5690 family protein [Puia sp.]|jgi:hypothetical protein|nr:DUF5690 family protein [Puia sp.]